MADRSDARLIIVSNRLPVTTSLEDGHVRLSAASGGLATGLGSWQRRSAAVWVGWPGDFASYTSQQRAELDTLLADAGVVPVGLSATEIEQYYEGFSNRVLWPLLHYLVDRVPVDATGWEAYRHVNQKFADAVAAVARPGDMIWVHDYQLMLVPALLRERLPDARIGFFLHVPFPSSEVFRILPWRQQILHGLLGADLVGFHTFSYLRHFLGALIHVDGLEAEVDRVRFRNRIVRLGVFPMSIDTEAFELLARDEDVVAEATAIRQEAGGRKILLGIDRLDYTKGIPRRLLAVERLLARDQEIRESVRYIQIAVPSRDKVDSYQTFRRQVEGAVGRINGAWGTIRSTPVHYVHRSISSREMAALYLAADVMLVTPLRDGMNLVAKEFVASRVDGDGVLVLSEFAGAAAELGEAVVVNPYDVDATAESIRQALTMTEAERRGRMQHLRRRVSEYTVHTWASTFLDKLSEAATPVVAVRDGTAAEHLAADLTQLRAADRLILLLDYDGTLVPIARAPELAVPDADLLDLLERLSRRPGTTIHIVSGRTREFLTRWLDRMPVSLWAEHGFWWRPSPGSAWQAAMQVSAGWIDRVLPILEQFTAATPGSLIELKTASVAWHYRMAHAEFGLRQAHELRMLLGDALSNQPLEVLEGKKVIEIRLRGVSKALVVRRILQQPAHDGAALLAIGDDHTDEELFAALPASAITVAVGAVPSRATHRVGGEVPVRAMLRALLP
ncbi:MAG TPA: bifunctional alpha,alpha-trehalose-phosphate synthase (UDP-forming)/trehalose-phosphatase [Thermomicrobiales bacterium]|nr:bifunctional alpha,alpha-trehalose-phosphate synthase (UDP-forming)/trehalose-phosphatase [Thermomicrobiales bacterium]